MIRIVNENDAEQLLKIYDYYVKNTAITFEYETPSVDEFKIRICNTLKKYPYLVSERNNKIVGYCYAGAFHERKAYDWAVETSIYIDKEYHGLGLGKELYTALEHALSLQNIINLNACIGYPQTEDKYLTKNSVQFHSHMGYRFVGEFYKCGYKFNRWYNMVYMEKCISDHSEKPDAIKKFPDVSEKIF